MDRISVLNMLGGGVKGKREGLGLWVQVSPEHSIAYPGFQRDLEPKIPRVLVFVWNTP